MDLNLVVLSGRLAAPPELRVLDSGIRLLRFLVTVRSESPRRRVDVVPVTLWDPAEDLVPLQTGDPVWVAGSVQRRFWDAVEGQRSRLEVVAAGLAPLPADTSDDSGTLGTLPVP